MGKVHKKKIAEYVKAAKDEVKTNKNKSNKKKNYFSDSSSSEDEQEMIKLNKSIGKTGKRQLFSEKQISSDSDEDLFIPFNRARKNNTGAKDKNSKNLNTKKADGTRMNDSSTDSDVVGDDEEYEVKDIVDHKIEHGVSYYLIRWKGYTKDDDTWEPESTLSCSELIKKFKEKNSVGNGKSKKKPEGYKKNEKSSPFDPSKEWEVEKIVDYAEDKQGRVFRIRWKGFTSKYDTWEPESNLYCPELITKFLDHMKSMENITFRELRETRKKTERLSLMMQRKSKRSQAKKSIYYGDSD